MKNNLKPILVILFSFLLFSGCQWFQDKDDPVVAQVDKNKLRMSDISRSLGYDPEPQIKSDFIDIWVEKQLWLKEAKRYSNASSDINELVKDYENSLIIKAYQQKHIFDAISITEGNVREYYKQHENEFTTYNDAAFIQLYKLLSKENADNLIENLKNSIQPNIPSEFKLIYKDEFIKVIDDLVFTSKSKKNIGPLKVDNYYYVIVIIEKYSKDSILAMEHVRSDIIQKLRAMAYITAIDKKQNELKDQYNVKIIKNTDN